MGRNIARGWNGRGGMDGVEQTSWNGLGGMEWVERMGWNERGGTDGVEWTTGRHVHTLSSKCHSWDKVYSVRREYFEHEVCRFPVLIPK